MRTRRPDIMFLIVLILIIAMGAILVVFNQRVIVPLGGDQVYAPIWEASRAAMRSPGANPYSLEAVSRASLLMGEGTVPRFLYPYYSLMLFGPFAQITPYSLSRAVWMTVCLACAVGLAASAVQLTRWRPGALAGIMFAVFALGRVEVVRALLLGNPSLVISLLAAMAMLMVVEKIDVGAGVLFGLTMIKPTMVALLLPFVLVWAVSQRRMRLVASLMVTITVLVAASFFIYPDWLGGNYAAFLGYYQASFPSSPAAYVWSWIPGAGPWAMGVTAILLAGLMLISWWGALGKDERWFLWTAALTLTITNLLGVPVSVSDHVLLLIPFALAFSVWSQRWPGQGNQLSLFIMAVILGAEWALFWFEMGGDFWGRPADIFWFLSPLTALVLLYWVRYWALDSIQLRTRHLEALRKL
ncbi:MAG: DUF2029 domain-containing protein [Anaerolineales bacterium]|nr:DUF2029 domain-containing protein [Anaerolineales bacterium]